MMGDFLKDGYWSNTNYVLGQEQQLYDDAVEVLASMSRPSVKYSVTRANLSYHLGYQLEDFRINTQIRLYDPYLRVNDLVYVKKITKYLDAPWKDTVEIANEKDITISGKSLDSTLQRVTSLANTLDQERSVFERARAINSNGNLQVDRLEGTIDLMRNQILSSVSGWYTDDNGNIMFVAADGQSAMMLSGEGFLIANGKNDNGEWNWRTAGSGQGLTADVITAGIINSNLIEANSITANKLASDVGSSLDLSSNVSVQTIVADDVEAARQEIMGDVTVEIQQEMAEAAPPVLYIDSSNGTIFRRDTASTDLTVKISWNGQWITTYADMQSTLGTDFSLAWQWRIGSGNWQDIAATDSHIKNNGFKFEVRPVDIQNRVDFRCSLVQAEQP